MRRRIYSLQKGASTDSIAPGGVLTYELAFQVLSGGGMATNAVITDALPDGLSYVSCTSHTGSDSFSANNDAATNTVTFSLGTLMPNAVGTVTFLAAVDASLTPGSVIDNWATLSCDQLPGGAQSEDTEVEVIASQRGNWWMFHHDAQHTGRSTATGPSSPALKWNCSTNGDVQSSPAFSANGTVYITSEDHNLYALNPATGTVKWSFATGSAIAASPAVNMDGTIYVGSWDGKLYALTDNGSSYALKWWYATGGAINSSPVISADGTTVYVGSMDQNLYALFDNGNSYILKWKCPTNGTIYSSPALDSLGNIYIGSSDDNIYAIYDNVGSYMLYWKYATGGAITFSSPAIGADGTVYCGSTDGYLYALGPYSNTLKWKYAAGGQINTTPALGADGTIYVGCDDHYLYALTDNGASCTLKWKYATDNAVYSSPAIDAAGTIYVGSEDDILYALTDNGTSASLKWEYVTGNQIFASPALGADGTVYIGSNDDKLYALGTAVAPALSLSKSVSPANALAGGTITYTLAYGNTGGSLASSVTLTDIVPSGVSYVAGSASNLGSYNSATHTLTWSLGVLAVNGTGQVTFQATVSAQAGAGSTIPNSASITCYEVPTPVTSNTATVTVVTSVRGDRWMFHHDVKHTGRSTAVGPTAPSLKWSNATQGDVTASPAFSVNGTIYIGSMDGKLYAFNPNGSLKWQYTAGGSIASSPALGADGTIYFGCQDDGLYALTDSGASGTLKWKYTASDMINSSPVIGTNGTIYFGSNDEHLYALNDNGGSCSLKWKYAANSWVESSPAIGTDGTIYVGSLDHNLYALTDNGGTCALKWSYTAGGGIYSSPAIGANGAIYFGGLDNKLYAIIDSGASGTLKWSYATGGMVESSPALGADGTIYVGSNDHDLYAFTDNTTSATLKWAYLTGNQITSSPAVDANGTVYVGSKDDTLYAFNPATGAVLGSYATGAAIEGSPALGADGTLYVGSDDHSFNALSQQSSAPTISSFTPTSGGAGTVVTITGTNFTGATAVAFGGTAAASFSVTNDTTISATVGSGATGAVTVTAPGGTGTSSDNFTFTTSTAPTVTSFTPTSGGAGTVVTITGTNFTGATAVAFGGTAAASFSVTNDTTISATVGSGATGAVTVTAPGGTGTSSDNFTFTAGNAPTITSFTPTSGPAGTVVTITGTHFTGTGAVAFGAALAASFTVVNDTTIHATVSSVGMTGFISLTTPGGTATSQQPFTFIPAPYITAFTPDSGGPGTVVTITGAYFTGATAVAFGGTAAVSYTVVNDATITATVGSGTTGLITVTTPGGTGTSTDTFTFNSMLTAVTLTTTPNSPQLAGTAITLSATATGGTNVQFQFWLYNPAVTPAWSQLQAYSSSPTCIWTPALTGSYLISLTAKDGVTGTEVNATAWYTIATPLTAVSVTPSPASPQPPGTMITLTAAATGGTNVQFTFWLYNPNASPGWSQAQAFSALNSYQWTPTAPGAYLFSVTAQDATGTQVNTMLWYTIAGTPLTAVGVIPSLASPEPPNTAITLTATATGGTNVQFMFWLYNSAAMPAWSQVQALSSSNSYLWTPTATGSYLFSVTAQDATGTQVNTMLWYTIGGAPLTAVSVTPSLASPQPPGTAITLTATATGGTNVQFMFWLYNPAASPGWSLAQAFSAADSYQWTPAATGSYMFSITAQDASGTTVNTTLWYTIGVVPLTAVNLTTSPAQPEPPNTAITLTAAATGGSNVQYTFWVYNPTATPGWSQLQAFSTMTACTWTPAATGSYLLSVTAQDVTGTQVNTTLWYTITTAPLTAVTVIPSVASPQPINTAITLYAAGNGGRSVQYMFWIYNPSVTPAWSELQAYSYSTTCLWTPSSSGSYLLSVTAQDATGATANTLLWYNITGAPLTAVNVTPSLASPQPANTPITLTATATGGTNVQYQFWVYNPNASPGWSQLQAYSPLDTCSWTPTKGGSYMLSITAQDGITGADGEYHALVYHPINSRIITSNRQCENSAGNDC